MIVPLDYLNESGGAILQGLGENLEKKNIFIEVKWFFFILDCRMFELWNTLVYLFQLKPRQ